MARKYTDEQRQEAKERLQRWHNSQTPEQKADWLRKIAQGLQRWVTEVQAPEAPVEAPEAEQQDNQGNQA